MSNLPAVRSYEPEPMLLSGYLRASALCLPEGLDQGRWRDIVYQLIAMEHGAPWWLGDALRYGERVYGETYSQVTETTGYAVQTLKNAMWVAGRFESSRRRDDLSFAHHAEVAALEPLVADAWLDLAWEESLTVKELRGRLREARGQQGDNLAAPLPPATLPTAPLPEPPPAPEAEEWEETLTCEQCGDYPCRCQERLEQRDMEEMRRGVAEGRIELPPEAYQEPIEEAPPVVIEAAFVRDDGSEVPFGTPEAEAIAEEIASALTVPRIEDPNVDLNAVVDDLQRENEALKRDNARLKDELAFCHRNMEQMRQDIKTARCEKLEQNKEWKTALYNAIHQSNSALLLYALPSDRPGGPEVWAKCLLQICERHQKVVSEVGMTKERAGGARALSPELWSRFEKIVEALEDCESVQDFLEGRAAFAERTLFGQAEGSE